MTAPGPRYEHLYVHVPFCGRRCSYCDFAIAVRREVPVSEYNDAIMAEIATRGVRADWGGIKSVYLGGGTPSKLGGDGIENLLARLGAALDVENSGLLNPMAEVTIEVNPEDVNRAAAARWVAAGVNRASIGVQSFDPEVLRWMHREHSVEQVRESVGTLRSAGVRSLSLDLIFSVPDRSGAGRDWRRDLDLALELEPEHLSVYGLTVEPKTPLGRWTARGEVGESPEERYEAEFLEADRRLTAAGFDHYEVSNYGRPGHRARHNSAYWSGVPYLALGPAAHGFDGRVRRWNVSAYAEWLRIVGSGRDPVGGEEELGSSERAAEAVYLGLRTTDGLMLHQNELMTVTPWIDAGWAVLSGDRLVLTPLGWLRLDALAASLTSHRSHS